MSKPSKPEDTLPEPPMVAVETPRVDVDRGTKSPREWFAALAPAKETSRERTNRLAEHNAAATVHGWKLHRHHTAKPIQLSRADYEGALKAAASGKGRAGLHTSAVSPHARKAR